MAKPPPKFDFKGGAGAIEDLKVTGLKWAVVKRGIPPDDWWWARINCWSNDEPKRHDRVEVVPDGKGPRVSKEGVRGADLPRRASYPSWQITWPACSAQ
jgi:hypothetical protein